MMTLSVQTPNSLQVVPDPEPLTAAIMLPKTIQLVAQDSCVKIIKPNFRCPARRHGMFYCYYHELMEEK